MKTPHYADIHVGKRLHQLRKMRGVSQKDLGERLTNPITFQQLQKYEKGANRLSASRLVEEGAPVFELTQGNAAQFLDGFPQLQGESEDVD